MGNSMMARRTLLESIKHFGGKGYILKSFFRIALIRTTSAQRN
jgi:hypothetical protein